MENHLLDHLQRDLPMLKSADRADIARVMVGRDINRSSELLIASIVDSRVEIGLLLSPLLRYEWMAVQDIMKSIDQGNLNEQLASFSICVERFNVLQNAIVAAFDRRWHCELEKEVSARVLAECNAQWLTDGQVHLHNFFNEMPVVAKARYRAFSGTELSVEVSPEVARVFACTQAMEEAHISSQDRKHEITVNVISCSAGVLYLSVNHVKLSQRECRENVRIRLAKPLGLRIKYGTQMHQAELIDISASGLRMRLPQSEGIQTGARIACSWVLGDQTIICEADVCWEIDAGDSFLAGVKFRPMGKYSELLRKFIFARQQQIVSRLKQLGAPSWVKK